MRSLLLMFCAILAALLFASLASAQCAAGNCHGVGRVKVKTVTVVTVMAAPKASCAARSSCATASACSARVGFFAARRAARSCAASSVSAVPATSEKIPAPKK